VTRAETMKGHALAVGDAWVENVTFDLQRDNRAATGGWPGTMREARARTCAHFRGIVITSDELEQAARAAYQHARHRWLAHARTDEECE
jgi:hypothetical protein